MLMCLQIEKILNNKIYNNIIIYLIKLPLFHSQGLEYHYYMKHHILTYL